MGDNRKPNETNILEYLEMRQAEKDLREYREACRVRDAMKDLKDLFRGLLDGKPDGEGDGARIVDEEERRLMDRVRETRDVFDRTVRGQE